MTTSHPSKGRLQHDPGSAAPPDETASVPDWFEARIPAVFAAVLTTWVLITAWKLLRAIVW